MTFFVLSEAIFSVLRDHHDEPRQWITENQRRIQERARADGGGVFLSILEDFCKQRPEKLRFFFEDYPGCRERYIRQKADESRQHACTNQLEGLNRDRKNLVEIRAEGVKYFEGDEWQRMRRRLGMEAKDVQRDIET